MKFTKFRKQLIFAVLLFTGLVLAFSGIGGCGSDKTTPGKAQNPQLSSQEPVDLPEVQDVNLPEDQNFQDHQPAEVVAEVIAEKESTVIPPELNEPNAPAAVTEPNLPAEPDHPVEITEEPNLPPIEAEPNHPDHVASEPENQEPNLTEPQVADPEPNTPAILREMNEEFAYILENFVDEKGMVDYSKLRFKRGRLYPVLKKIRDLDPAEYATWSIEDKTAFWINAYNAHMLDIILKYYPIEPSRIRLIFWPADDIRHISDIWTKKFLVMDEEFTLNQVDERIFKKELKNPMVFFALCQAHISSPPLRNEPYVGIKLDSQLKDQAKRFLSRETAFRVDRQDGVVWLSNILSPTWNGKEFLTAYGTNKRFKSHPPHLRAVLNFISSYVSPGEKAFLELKDYSVKYIRHNWQLNKQ